MPLSHRQIEVFRAVMATGQVTRAAEQLGRSQPTVSRELASLERTLGLTLFDRERGRLRPTVRAHAWLEEVERSFIGLDQLAAAALGLRDFAEGRLTLVCQPALAHALLPDATRRFMDQHPGAGLTVTTQESPQLEQWLTEQRFDLGLTEVRQAPPATRLVPLLQADEVVVLPEAHALAARAVIRPEDFEGQSFVSLAPADPYRRAIDDLFEQRGVRRALAIEAASAAAVCAFVRRGLGLAIVNPLTALELAGAGLQLRRLSVSVPFHLSLVVPTLRARNPLLPAFEASLVAAALAMRGRLKAVRRGT